MSYIEEIIRQVTSSVRGTPPEKLAALKTAITEFLRTGPDFVPQVDTVLQLAVHRNLAGCALWLQRDG